MRGADAERLGYQPRQPDALGRLGPHAAACWCPLAALKAAAMPLILQAARADAAGLSRFETSGDSLVQAVVAMWSPLFVTAREAMGA
jgi:hypothetical protein